MCYSSVHDQLPPRGPAEDKLSYPVGRIIILSEDSPDIG